MHPELRRVPLWNRTSGANLKPKHRMNNLLLTITCAASLGLLGHAADAPAKVDNTAKNERDRSKETKTPVDESNAPEDIKITQDIRKAIVKDNSLSMTAKNVKVITAGGQVTLRGPVNNADEKAKIAAAAKSVAGETKVIDQLEIKH